MSASRPPRWARAIARLLVRGPHHEFVLGDLDELWARSRHSGLRRVGAFLHSALGCALLDLREAMGLGLRLDVIVALRQFRRRPRVYLGGALVLAVGLGVSTLTWGVRYGATGRNLPVSDPERVFGLRVVDVETNRGSDLSAEDAFLIRTSVPEVEAVGLWTSTSANLVDESAPPELVVAYAVHPDLFSILELSPLHGRLLVPSDDAPGAPPVAVLGHRHWSERYGADPALVGRSILLDGRTTEVVGVLGPGMGLTAHEDIWLPTSSIASSGEREFNALARLRAGADPAATGSRLAALASARSDAADPSWMGRSIRIESFADAFYGGVRSVRDRVLSIGGILLLVMALANVANLFSVATRARARELSIRRALGAGRGRVIRQLMIEAGIPALIGFLGATAIAAWTLSQYQIASDQYGVGFTWQVYRLERAHLLLLLAGSLAATVVVSLVAAARELVGDGRLGPGTVRGGQAAITFRTGWALLGIEIAVAMSLLLLSSLMIGSAWNLRAVDFDFAMESVMTADVTLSGTRYAEPDARLAFWGALDEALREVPGVQEATVGAQLPLIRCCNNGFRFELDGWEVDDPSALPTHYGNGVSPSYFATFERPVLAGRGVLGTDRPDGEPIAVVNVHFAARYFPAESPIGRRLRMWRGAEPGPWRTIVGVAPDLWMDTDVNENPEGVYVPLSQLAPARASMAIRVEGPPEAYADALRAAVQRLDPELPVSDVRSMPELFRNRTSLYRLVAPLFALLGGAALFLAIGGLYSIVSYMTSLRIPELGLRAALGATRRELMTRSLTGAATPTALGIAAGLAVGLRLTAGFDRFVFLVDPWSPAVIAATVTALVGCCALASLRPAARAGRVDPVEALRAE